MLVLTARRAGISAALAAVAVALPAAASAHGGEHAPTGMSERQFDQFEEAVLGPEHAAQHAEERREEAAAKRASKTAGKPPKARTAQSADPASAGSWSSPFPLPALAIHTVMLPTGKLLIFAYPRRPTEYNVAENFTKAYLVDPTNGATKSVPPPSWRDPKTGKVGPANIFCAGATLLSDGQVLVVGGNLEYENEKWYYKGLKKAYTFDPWTERWTEQPQMRHGRWYPTAVRMADGQTLVVAGYDEHQHTDAATGYNTDVELFTPPARRGGKGRWALLAQEGLDGAPFADEPYPHLFAMPSGRVLAAGPHRVADTWFMDEPGPFPTFNWGEAPNMAKDRYYGNAVLLPGTPAGGSTKVMEIGGTDPAKEDIATATSEVFDEAKERAGWKAGPSWNVARSHANTVQLPDGSMVTVGGGTGVNEKLYDFTENQKQVELFDPASGAWRLGAAQAEGRTYHSTAVLLPDGRVFSGGDDLNGGDEEDTGEIYSPPYLFKGPRPEITAAPTQVAFGATFGVSVAGPAAAKAVLVAPGATTHAVDMNQRVVPLAATRRADGGLDVTAPRDGYIAPPGHYMLFVLDAAGVPSVATWIAVGSATPPKVARDLAKGRTWKDGRLDLGRRVRVDRIALRWGKSYPTHYVVNGSADGKRYVKLGYADPYKPYWQTTELGGRMVRYLKLTAIRRSGKKTPSLAETRLYGT